MFSSSLVFIVLLAVRVSQAWVPSSGTGRTASSAVTRLFSTTDKKGNANSHSDSKFNNRTPDSSSSDLERTRIALEEFMKMNPGPSAWMTKTNDHTRRTTDSTSDNSSAFMPMTSAGRRRRQLEIGLLRQMCLDDGAAIYTSHDKQEEESLQSQQEESANNMNAHHYSCVVDELVHLWMYEHGPEPAAQLEAMQEICTPGMALEEQQLRAMMDQYPTWAEPRARLAMLLFMKGISDEARDLALEALKLKPWHFDVYPLLITLSLRCQDMGQALYWARQSLPTYRPNSAGNRKRLKAWVDRALAQASDQWEQAERETLQQQELLLGDANDDCWQ